MVTFDVRFQLLLNVLNGLADLVLELIRRRATIEDGTLLCIKRLGYCLVPSDRILCLKVKVNGLVQLGDEGVR